jgi:hypothetical protein
MRDMDDDPGSFWDDFDDRESAFSEQCDPASQGESYVAKPGGTLASIEERVEAASATAWARFEDPSRIVTGNTAYDSLSALYFSLRKQLFRHARLRTFTKNECCFFSQFLAGQPLPTREQRQTTESLNKCLRANLALVPSFSIANLREVAKRCAAKVDVNANLDG